MLRIDKTHSMEDYMALLNTSKKIFIDNARLDRAIKDACAIADDYKSLTLLNLRIESSGSYQELNNDTLIGFLCDIGVDLDKRYANKKTKSYSLDMKKVIEPLIADGVQVELLTAYKTYRSYNSYASFLRKQLGTHRPIHGKTSDGRIILGYDTELEERDNLRVYYHDIAVVSIPKIFSSMITTPSEEYHLAWCDYPQADWRFAYNLFIKDETNEPIMRKCEDTYEGLARIIEGDDFNPETFKESRKLYKVHCLSTFYNSHDKRPVPTAMREYFRSRYKYGKYFYDLQLLQKFRLPVPVTSYFGYEQLIPEASYPDAFLSKGLNTPIQTFTSHVVNETVFGILEKFWDLGYTKDDINVYYVRHDEPLFIFKDTILKDAWIFEDCSEIHIDGFTPIKLDFHFGDYYLEENEILTEEIQRMSKMYPERISHYDVGTMKDYYPVPSIESVYVQCKRTDENGEFIGLKVHYYDYRRNRKFAIQTDKKEMKEAIYDTLPRAVRHLWSPRYLLVYNNGVEVELDYIESLDEGVEPTLIKIISKYDSSVVLADG